MAKKNNIPMVSAVSEMMNSFKPEKLSLNPIKRHRQKKVNAMKRKNLQALAVASATTGIAGGAIGAVSGYHVGKKRRTKMVLETMEEYGINQKKMQAILDKKASKDILLADGDDDEEESDDSAPRDRHHDKDPVAGSILIREDVGVNDYVVSPTGDIMDGFCLNGTEDEHVVATMLYGRGIQAMDYVNVIHDFDSDLGEQQGEWIRAFCEEHNIRINEVDDAKYHHKTVRDEAVDENGNLAIGQGDGESDEDDLLGMNSVTDQSVIDVSKFPTPVNDEPEEDDEEDESEEESEDDESVFVAMNGDAVHLTKAPENVDPAEIDAFFFGKASKLFMARNPDVDEADIKLVSVVDDQGHTILDLAYSLYQWYMRKLAAQCHITDPTVLREKFDELMKDYRKRQDAREEASTPGEKTEPEKTDELEEDEEDGELFGVPDFGNSVPDDMTDEPEDSETESADDNKEESK